MIAIFLYDTNIQLESVLKIPCNGKIANLALRGIIYSGQFHFTCKLLSSEERVWYHDGQTTASTCRYEGSIDLEKSLDFLKVSTVGNLTKVATILIYAR